MPLGEDRVRLSFNPSNNLLVAEIKQKSADIINLLAVIPKPDDEKARNEVSRMIALAQTRYEEAAMWAVKAATA